MVEYTVDTLVHLYDSLNNQIAEVIDIISEGNKIGYDPNLAEHYVKELNRQHQILENRLERLNKMRDNVEELLNKILTAEVRLVNE